MGAASEASVLPPVGGRVPFSPAQRDSVSRTKIRNVLRR